MLKPSRRREMAQRAVKEKSISIRLTCLVFSISETCYRYQAKLTHQNTEIAGWLIRLTHNHRNWGFGLCFLYLSNVKGFRWNHKRVYRIYRELELNLRIKLKKCLVRDKPQPLSVPEAMNVSWSMDFMHDQLSDGRSYRLFMTLIANQYLFESIAAVQDYATQWLRHYNKERPNMGLGGITPKQKLAMWPDIYF